MSNPSQHKRSLPRLRRYLCDLLQIATSHPESVAERAMNLCEVEQAKCLAIPQPSWHAIFLKTMALLQQRYPELRRSFLPCPMPRWIQPADGALSVPVEREHEGEQFTCFALLRQADQMSLGEIEDFLCRLTTVPIQELSGARRAWRMGLLPGWIRRGYLRIALSWSSSFRVKHFGTGSVSTTSTGPGCGFNPLQAMVPTLCYQQPEKGRMTARLVYDPRVIHAGLASESLAAVESILHQQILVELRYQQRLQVA